MGILLGIAISIFSIFLIALLRSFTTLFHEMGHAIPALLFTDGRVVVYIGSYGDISNSLELHMGRLSIYFKINLFDWQIGLCKFESIPAIWKRVLITTGGPIASLLIAIPLIYVAFSGGLQLHWILLIGIFAIAAIMDFVFNMIPVSSPLQLHNGTVAYTDGYQLLHLFARMRLSDDYLKMEKLVEQERYRDSILFADEALDRKLDRSIFLLKIESHLKIGQRKEALLTYDEYIKDFQLHYDDFFNLGKIYKELGNNEEAMVYFNRCFHKRFDDPLLLNSIGDILVQQGDYPLAIKRLTGAIFNSENYLEPYLHRAKAFIKIKEYHSAKNDLEKIINEESLSFEAYYQLGILYERQGKYEFSCKAFQKAHEINPEHPGLAFKIELIKEHVVS